MAVPNVRSGGSWSGATVSVRQDGDWLPTSLNHRLNGAWVGGQVDAPADFYVDSVGGSNSNDGLTVDTPKLTLAAVQASLTSGKKVALRRGSRFSETLTLGASGITVAAYGPSRVLDADGYCTNAPIIDGGAFQTGWAAYSGGDETRPFADTFTGTAGTDLTAHTPDVGISWVRHDNWASSTTNAVVLSNANRARRKTGTSQAQYLQSSVLSIQDYYVEADVYVASTDIDFIEVIARGYSYTDKGYWARLGGAAGTLAIGRRVAGTNTSSPGSTTVAAVLGAGLVVGDTYTLRIEVEGSTIRGYINNGGAFSLFDTWVDITIGAGDHAMAKFGSGSAVAPDDTHGLHVDNFQIGALGVTGSPVNTFKSTGTVSQVYVVEVDGDMGFKGANVDQLNDGEWFWQNNKLYVRRDAGSPGATDVVTGARSFGIDLGTHTDVTIDGIAFEHQSQRAITSAPGADRLTIQRSMVQNGCSAEQGNNGCIGVFGNDATVSRCVVRHVNNDGIYVNVSAGAAPQITDNLIGPLTGFAADGVQVDASESATVTGYIARNYFRMTDPRTPKGGLILFGGGYTVEDNYFEGAGVPSTGSGNYGVSLAGNSMTVRNNVFYNIPNDAIRSASNSPTATRTLHQYYGNITVDCGQGIRIGLPSTGFLIYGNTIVNVHRSPQFQSAADYALHAYSSVTGELKDNIIWNTSGGGLGCLSLDGTVTSFARDFNTIGPETTSFYKVGATSYNTIAAVVSALTQEASTLHSDPLFANLGGFAIDGSDYIPAALSPVVGSGLLVPGYVHVRDMGAKTISPVDPVPPSVITPPSLTGLAIDGYSLSVDRGVWESGDIPTFTYQWWTCDGAGANCTLVVGATAPSYGCVTADVGNTLKCVVTVSNQFGSATVTTGVSSPVAANVDPATGPDLVTDTLTDTTGTVLSAHTPEAGSSYVKHPLYTPTAVITAGGRARHNGGAGVSSNTLYRNLTVLASASYDVKATIFAASATDVAFRTGIVARCDASADTFYLVRYSGANEQWEFIAKIAGTDTVLDTYPKALSSGQTVTVLFVVRDALKRVFIDGVERMSSSDNSITAAGSAGMRLGDAGGTDSTGLQVDTFRVISV